MENSNYNSLTDKLIQNGILSSTNKDKEKSFFESYYGIELDEDMSNSPFAQPPIENTEKKNYKKRINKFDNDLIQSDDMEKEAISALKTLKRFLNFKENSFQKSSFFNLENLFHKFFPRLYKARLIKEAMLKFDELNIDTKALLDKTIPYGESEGRYKDLIKYLNYANEIQTRLKKKF